MLAAISPSGMSIRKTISLDQADWQIAPVPAWTEVNEPDWSFSPPDEYPVAVLLFDEQHDVSSGAVYYRNLRKLRTLSAVQSLGQIEVEFDPAANRLRIHDLAVWRSNLSGDLERRCETKRDAFMLRQREQQLEQQMLNGRLSLVALLEDIRVGDIIELAWSLEQRDPLPGLKFTAYYAFVWAYPVGRAVFSLHYGTEPPPKWTMHTQDGIKTPDATATDTRSKWLMNRPEPMVFEPNAPGGFWPFPILDVSNWSSWTEVAAFVAELWKDALDEGADNVKSQIEELNKQPSKDMAIRAAIRNVQESIRYLAVDFGHGGGILPNGAGTVMRRRFGDCKDKSVLLTALLRGLGVEAWPLLVAPNWRQALRRVNPSTSAFGHSIVTFIYNGRRHFVDPTLLGQGGRLSEIIPPPYELGLEVRSDAPGLISIPEQPVPEFAITEVFTLHHKLQHSVLLQTVRATAGLADDLRALFVRDGIMRFAKVREDELKKSFSTLRLVENSPQLTDDQEANEIELSIRYELPTWGTADQKLPGVFRYGAQGLLIVLDMLDGPNERKTPWQLRPMKINHRAVVEGRCVQRLKAEKHKVNGPAFDYTCTVSWENKQAIFDYRWNITKREVGPKEWPEYVAKREKAFQNAGLNVLTPTSFFQCSMGTKFAALVFIGLLLPTIFFIPKKESERHALRNNPVTATEHLISVPKAKDSIMKLLRAGKVEGARKIANDLVNLYPQVSESWRLLGICAHTEGEYPTAERAFKKAILLEPNNPQGKSDYGYFLAQQNRLEEALQIIEPATRQFPEIGLLWINYAVCLEKLGRQSEANKARIKGEQLMTPAQKQEVYSIQEKRGDDLKR